MTTNDSLNEELPIVKTDVLGRVKIDPKHREVMLDTFEASGMSTSAFALQHGVKQQTFASWIQKRRRKRGDYENEEIRRKLCMGKKSSELTKHRGSSSKPSPVLNFIELDTELDTGSKLSQREDALEVRLSQGVVIRLQSESQIPLLKTLVEELGC